MYADDTNITAVASNIHNLELILNNELSKLNNWLTSNKLSLNIAKTEFMLIGSRQKLATQTDSSINLDINGNPIKQVKSSKSLGMIIDENLSWNEHINKIAKKASAGIGALKRIRHLITEKTATKIFQALIQPYFDYCSEAWDGISNELSDKLQKLQNRAVRIITKSSFDTSAKPLISHLGLTNLANRRQFQIAKIMFKILNKRSPKYLIDLFCYKNNPRNLRNSEKKLVVPNPRTNYAMKSFGYKGAVTWNELPQNLRMSKTIHTFKKNFKQTQYSSGD